MKPAHATSVIFGLRYLEEEDLESNDIIGCQSAVVNPNFIPDERTVEVTQYNTYTDVPDYDRAYD